MLWILPYFYVDYNGGYPPIFVRKYLKGVGDKHPKKTGRKRLVRIGDSIVVPKERWA